MKIASVVKVVEMASLNNEFVTGDDGFVMYWPRGVGGLTAQDLRDLADELDNRNKAWEEDINAYFTENNNT